MKTYKKEAKLCCPHCEGKGYLIITSDDLRRRIGYTGNYGTKEIRNNLRKLKKEGKLEKLSLRSIGKLIGLNSAQQVKHHLLQLDKIGWNKLEK